MKLCPSEADFRPVSGRVHHVSDQFLIGIEGCRYKDQASLFPTHHDDSGWCGCSSNHGYIADTTGSMAIAFLIPLVCYGVIGTYALSNRHVPL